MGVQYHAIEKPYLGQGTTQEIGEEVQTPVTPKSKRRTRVGFDPAGVKSLLNVDERDKGVLVTAEAQGIHKAEGHSVGTPAEPALGSFRVVENVGAMRA